MPNVEGVALPVLLAPAWRETPAEAPTCTDRAASAERSAVYPEAPTLREQGFPDVVATGWYGFLAPGATPAPITDRFQATVLAVLADPVVKKKLLVQGLEVHGTDGAAFGKFIDEEAAKWSKVIKDAGIKGG